MMAAVASDNHLMHQYTRSSVKIVFESHPTLLYDQSELPLQN